MRKPDLRAPKREQDDSSAATPVPASVGETGTAAPGEANPSDRANVFDEEYYRCRLGAVPYGRNDTWLQFFSSVADHIIRSLKPRSVLDVGCAMGFLVEALWDRGVEAWGIDISAHAISKVRNDMRPYCLVASVAEPIAGTFDLITCIEVLEHIPADQTEAALNSICRATDLVLFSSTPYDFAEPTHCNMRPLMGWVKLFSSHGFWPDLSFDASFVAQHAMLLRREDLALPDEVLALFCRVLHQKSALVEKLKKIMRLTEEASGLSSQLRQLKADRDSLSEQLSMNSARLQEVSQERAVLAEAAARLETERESAKREVLDATLRLGQLEQHNAQLRVSATELETARQAVLAETHSARQRVAELQQECAIVRGELNLRESERDSARGKVAEVSSRGEELKRENLSLGETIRSLSGEREELQRGLREASHEQEQLRSERSELVGSIKWLETQCREFASQLRTIQASPGWRAIEKYRGWRLRHVARSPWLCDRYETVVSLLLRWIGVIPNAVQANASAGATSQPPQTEPRTGAPGQHPAGFAIDLPTVQQTPQGHSEGQRPQALTPTIPTTSPETGLQTYAAHDANTKTQCLR